MDTATLKSLYYQMLRIRLIEERIAAVYPQQEIRCPTHLSIGQEAVAVGVCANLGADDYVMSSHRSHAHYLAKGGDLRAMIAEIYGRATGCSQGKGGSMHLIDKSVGFLGATPIVGSTVPISVGLAFASVMKGEPRVSVAFFGDGASEEGVTYESINFAVLKNLPVIFVCENNFYSVYSALSVRQPNREIHDMVRGHGLESCQGDGNDILVVHALAEKAVTRARQGGGPSFLEFKTYRWREHCGPNYDNELGYRTVAEFEDWRGRCPVAKLRGQLLRDRILSEEEDSAMVTELDAEVDEAVSFARSSPFPIPDALLGQVFATRIGKDGSIS